MTVLHAFKLGVVGVLNDAGVLNHRHDFLHGTSDNLATHDVSVPVVCVFVVLVITSSWQICQERSPIVCLLCLLIVSSVMLFVVMLILLRCERTPVCDVVARQNRLIDAILDPGRGKMVLGVRVWGTGLTGQHGVLMGA